MAKAVENGVAQDILRLLGWPQLEAMVKPTDLCGNHDSISFRISYFWTKGFFNKFDVTRVADGTHVIQGFRIGDGRTTLVEEKKGVNGEDLGRTFEEFSRMRTR